jgi:hypothetical protein
VRRILLSRSVSYGRVWSRHRSRAVRCIIAGLRKTLVRSAIHIVCRRSLEPVSCDGFPVYGRGEGVREGLPGGDCSLVESVRRIEEGVRRWVKEIERSRCGRRSIHGEGRREGARAASDREFVNGAQDMIFQRVEEIGSVANPFLLCGLGGCPTFVLPHCTGMKAVGMKHVPVSVPEFRFDQAIRK